ncbi:hypothetical protein FEDK69T_25010 [Flavobacterium enshiense DK69]|nr:hypothetical protein FEDK69T_25010 [Flavobacterium enshiense DK69]
MKQIIFLFIAFYANSIIAQIVSKDLSFDSNSIEKALNLIPVGQEKNFGFNTREEFAESKIGVPLLVTKINSDGKLSIQNEWRIPVVVNNEYRLLFTVIKNTNGEFEIVDLGGSSLAKEISTIVINGKNPDVLLRSYAFKIDFLSVNELITASGLQNCIIPLQSAKNFFLSNKRISIEDTISRQGLTNLMSK